MSADIHLSCLIWEPAYNKFLDLWSVSLMLIYKTFLNMFLWKLLKLLDENLITIFVKRIFEKLFKIILFMNVLRKNISYEVLQKDLGAVFTKLLRMMTINHFKVVTTTETSCWSRSLT
jgi:hypothetical protein